ncbi:hypothetical protein CEXT_61891 [Caerostris extrusa]|uniref:Uncharacterized protein n=1 Tax=Caerostris extrusa TaxID=172846 RepID=A0AAV4MV67_CAEEX|nr:hypothetical protein CEXT_61891 [Caerostris extrusa]
MATSPCILDIPEVSPCLAARVAQELLTHSAFQSIPGGKSSWLKFLQKEQHAATEKNQILRKSFHRYSIEMNHSRRVGRNSILFISAICRKLDGFSVLRLQFIHPSFIRHPRGLSSLSATHSIFVAANACPLSSSQPPPSLLCWKIMDKGGGGV